MKAYFIPTAKEAESIFPGCGLKPYKYGILTGEYNGIPLFVTGTTKTSSAFSSHVIISEFKVKKAILTGICGAYRQSGLKVGDVVTVHRDFFADEGVFYSDRIENIHEMGFGFAKDGCSQFVPYAGLPIVNSNTVSYLDGEGDVSALLYAKYGAQTENMEGAAFGFVCNMMGIEASQVRAVSNFCGKRDSQEWNVRLAFQNLKNLFE